MYRYKILVADDDAMLRPLLEARLTEDGYDVLMATDVRDAQRIFQREALDLAVLDLRLLSSDPHDVSGALLAANDARGIPTILFTGQHDLKLGPFFQRLEKQGLDPNRLPKILFKPQNDDDPSFLELRGAIRKKLVPRVFVVHGHNRVIRDEVETALRELKLDVTILENQPGKGAPILKKFKDEAARCQFAVVLLTGDDLGASRVVVESRTSAGGDIHALLHNRSRQNVILELGYFLSLLDSERVLVLYEDGVELPSDYNGILYVSIDSDARWKKQLATELIHARVVHPDAH